MRAMAGLLATAVMLASATGCRASDHDFNGVVDGLESHYGIHGHKLPMMGFAGFCAGIVTHGGVRGLRVAEFEHLTGGPLDADDVSRVIGEELGEEWRPVVKDHERHGLEQTVIFVRPVGKAMRMLIVNFEKGELDVVRVELDGEQLSKFLKDPVDPMRGSRHGSSDSHDETAEKREPL